MKRAESNTSLKAWFDAKARGERADAIKAFANSHRVSPRTAYNYMSNHPLNRKAMAITEAFTKNQVTRFDIAPEVFDRDELKQLLLG